MMLNNLVINLFKFEISFFINKITYYAKEHSRYYVKKYF